MAKHLLADLMEHSRCLVTLAKYEGPDGTLESCTLECLTCGEVLLEFYSRADGSIGLGAIEEELPAEQRNAYIEAAKRCYDDPGAIEVDDNATVSAGGDGNGAYVQAWVYVYNEEAGLPEKDQEEDHAAAIPA